MGTNFKSSETAMAIIFIKTNLQVVCVIANLSNSIPSAVETERPATFDSTTLVSTPFKDDPDLAPLPANSFTVEVSDFLSPDMFSQANPFVYFLKKATKLPYQTVRKISVKMWRTLHMTELKFPQRYIPYAEFASALLASLHQLHDIEEITRRIQSNNAFTLPDIITLDPVLSPLFSSYVFMDQNPPNRLLFILMEIPEDEIESVPTRLQKLLNNRYFPRLYSHFAKCILQFFKPSDHLYRRLRTKLVEIREVVLLFPEHYLQIDNDIDLPGEDSDTSVQPQPPEKLASTISNNDPDISLDKRFRSEVRNFLSPDMFSQADPFAYLLAKAIRLQKDILRHTSYYLEDSLDRDEFPARYTPYAELARSLLSCLEPLENLGKLIEDYRRTMSHYRHSLPRTVLKFDPELSKLFSDDMFAKGDPRPRLLTKLLDIPENKISDFVKQLQDCLKDPYFSPRYRRYVNFLIEFLSRDYLILRLRDNIAEIRRMLTLNSSTPDQSNSTAQK